MENTCYYENISYNLLNSVRENMVIKMICSLILVEIKDEKVVIEVMHFIHFFHPFHVVIF